MLLNRDNFMEMMFMGLLAIWRDCILFAINTKYFYFGFKHAARVLWSNHGMWGKTRVLSSQKNIKQHKKSIFRTLLKFKAHQPFDLYQRDQCSKIYQLLFSPKKAKRKGGFFKIFPLDGRKSTYLLVLIKYI